MSICPQGHRSAADDYCDQCGAPIAPPTPAPAPAAPAPAEITCPLCGTSNAADTLFCENCGYDFTTGAKPRPASGPSLLDLDAPLPAPANVEHDAPGAEGVASRGPLEVSEGVAAASAEASVGTDSGADNADQTPPPQLADPEGTEAAVAGAREQRGSESQPGEASALDLDAPLPAAEVGGDAPAEAASPALPSAPSPTAPEQPPALPQAVQSRRPEPLAEWDTVAEVWVDPDWYSQQTDAEPMPSPGLPTVVPLRTPRALIGRTSRSRGIEPELDCGVDSSVSRRQAELSTDGTRWWVEDLGSANGTYVGAPSAPLPTTPITHRTELREGDRIFVGAWTRIVLRPATPPEREAYR